MKLATWNVNSLGVRLPQVLDWLAANPVDVLALQELKMTDDKFPAHAFLELGYHAQCFGQKTYNGVALLSRTQPAAVVRNIPGFADDMARVIAATFSFPDTAVADVRIINGYFPNGQEPGSAKFAYKMAWLAALHQWIRAELGTHSNLVLLGDYNITFDDMDVWDPEGMRGQIHCTEEERQHLRALIDLGLSDSFRLFAQAPQNGKSYSWWDYRNFAFKRNHGLRIDHILVSQALVPLARSCVIDKTPRKNERPSDHAPVVLELYP